MIIDDLDYLLSAGFELGYLFWHSLGLLLLFYSLERRIVLCNRIIPLSDVLIPNCCYTLNIHFSRLGMILRVSWQTLGAERNEVPLIGGTEETYFLSRVLFTLEV